LKNIEESLARADLGATPLSKGGVIRLTLPSLSEERRKALLRLLREKLENSRQKARTVRDRIKEQIVASFKEKEINEDEKYRLIEELNKKISELNKKIELLGEEKEKEIMNI
jgi:ribosome recycling factor